MHHRVRMRHVVCALALASIQGLAFGQTCPAEWSKRFGAINLDGGPLAAVAWDDDGPGPHASALYVAGSFSDAGGIPVNEVAKWDGETWSSLAGGAFTPTGQGIQALAVFDDDGPGPHLPALYAAGDFTSIGGVSAHWIGRWDGTSWSALGSGLSGGTNSFPTVRALAVFDEDGAGPNPPALFAAGDFFTAGGVSARLIARWDGTNWSAVANGSASSSGATIRALVVHDADGTGPGSPKLYAGGSFTSLGGGTGANLAQWNGTSWSAVGSSNFNDVETLASVDHDGSGPNPPVLYAGGFYGFPINNALARFDGTTWSGVSGGVDGAVWGMSTIDDDGTGPLGEALYVGGTFTHAGGLPANNVARFDGTTWSALGSGITMSNMQSPVVYCLARFDADGSGPAPAYVYTGGFFDTAGGNSVSYIGRWDGTSWSAPQKGAAGAPLSNSGVRAFQVFDEDGAGPQRPALFAGGAFTQVAGQVAHRIARYDGSAWSTLSSGMDQDVYSLCVFDDDGAGPNPPALFAAGKFTTAGGVGAAAIAKWNGSSWVPLGSGINGFVSSLAVFDEDGAGPNPPSLFAAGFFSQAGGTAANCIARWDGTTWSALGVGLDGWTTALAVFDPDGPGPLPSTLIVGGTFSNAGGSPAAGIAQWDGLAWSSLGSGVGGSNPDVFALTTFDPDGAGPAPDQLIAGGSFTSAGGGAAGFIASWDGAAWTSLSSGLSYAPFTTGKVSSLVSFDVDGIGPITPVLYAGGDFNTAGGSSASGVAAWDGVSWSALDGGLAANFNYASCVSALATFDDDDTGPVQPAVYAGGDLENANGTISSFHIARWGAPPCDFTAFCAPGVGGVVTCPCGNPQVPAGSTKGCDNFAGGGTGGATLAGVGMAELSSDSLGLNFASGVGSSVTVLFQGTNNLPNSRTGAGVKCVGGTLKRLYKGNETAGAIAFPNNANSFHVQSTTKGYTIVPPVTLYYYAAYRNSAANGQPGCPGLAFGFNASNAVAVTWTP